MPSWSSLEVTHACTLCHFGLILAIWLHLWVAILVFSGDPQCSYSMPPWCHLGSFALSLGSHLGASSKSSSSIFWAILVFSGGPPCLYSMPLWSHHGHLALFLTHLIGLLWGSPMILLHASLVPSWQSCFFFEYHFLF